MSRKAWGRVQLPALNLTYLYPSLCTPGGLPLPLSRLPGPPWAPVAALPPCSGTSNPPPGGEALRIWLQVLLPRPRPSVSFWGPGFVLGVCPTERAPGPVRWAVGVLVAHLLQGLLLMCPVGLGEYPQQLLGPHFCVQKLD